jgi:hypothetical protein
MRTIFALAALSLATAPVVAQKPDFSGSWKLNAEASDPMGGPGGGGQRGPGGMGRATELFITHSDSKIVIEAKMGDQSRVTTYYLDGRESKNPGMRGAEMTTKSTWAENTIVTEGENTMTTPMGEMTIKTREVRSMSADGKQMTVVLTTTTPQGERTRKTVYDKA